MSRAKRCDRCGGYYSDSNEWYDGEVAELQTIEFINIWSGCTQKQKKHWDLCPDCTNKLNKWLKNEPFKEES